MSEESTRHLSRRRLLRAGWAIGTLAAVTPLLQACQQAPATPQVVEKTVEKTVEKVVTQVVERVVTATPAAGAQAGAKLVELKLSTDWNVGARKEVMDAAKREYEKNNPNVKIEHWHLGADGFTGSGPAGQIVVAQLMTGTAADVIGEVPWANYSTHFSEIGPVLKDIGWKEEDYVITPKTSLDLFFEGKQYGLPYNTVLTCYYYNVDMFEKAGVKPPTDAWTMDDMLAAARALSKPEEGIYGFHARDYMNWGWGDHIWADGAGIFSADGKKLLFCEGGGPDRFQWYVDLIYKHKVSPGVAEATKMLSPGVTEPFTTGKVAMTSGQSGSAGIHVRDIANRFKWSVMPTAKSPVTGKRAHYFEQNGLVVSALAKKRGHFEDAVKYAAFYNSDFVQKMYADLRPSMPAKKRWIQSEEYAKAPPLNMLQFYKNLTEGGDHLLMNPRDGTKPVGEYNEARNVATRHISTAFDPANAARAKAIFMEACDKGNEILAKVR